MSRFVQALGALLLARGRRPRLSYWRAVGAIPLVGGIVGVAASIAIGALMPSDAATEIVVSGFALAFWLAMTWCWLAVGIQRLHDRDASGWWVLLALVPIVGTAWYLFWNGLKEGTPGANRFGPNPQLSNAAVAAIFEDGPAPRPHRPPLISTMAVWTALLLLFLGVVALFQAPGPRAPRPAAIAPSQNSK